MYVVSLLSAIRMVESGVREGFQASLLFVIDITVLREDCKAERPKKPLPFLLQILVSFCLPIFEPQRHANINKYKDYDIQVFILGPFLLPPSHPAPECTPLSVPRRCTPPGHFQNQGRRQSQGIYHHLKSTAPLHCVCILDIA